MAELIAKSDFDDGVNSFMAQLHADVLVILTLATAPAVKRQARLR